MIATGKHFRSRVLSRAAITLAIACSLSASAQAGAINFNPTGGQTFLGGFINPGTVDNVVSFDLGAGDAIATDAFPNGKPLAVGSTFQLYYQTTITGFTLQDGTKYTPLGLNQLYQLTEVATFNETVTSIGSNGSVAFALTPGGSNLTQIYYSALTPFPNPTNQANASTGANFANGTLIMSLSTTSDSSNYTDTTKSGATPGTPLLNQAGSGSFHGVTTDQGTGSVSLGLSVSSGYNSAFFTTAGISSSLFSSNIKLPFTEIAPSTGFTNPFAPGSPIGVSVGSNNGTSGPDFLLQISGAAQSFSTVPEPASIAMTILGLGGFGLGSFVARRRKAVV